MMQDWNAYRDSLMERVGDYAKQMTPVSPAIPILVERRFSCCREPSPTGVGTTRRAGICA